MTSRQLPCAFHTLGLALVVIAPCLAVLLPALPDRVGPVETGGVRIVADNDFPACTLTVYDADTGNLMWEKRLPDDAFYSDDFKVAGGLLYAPTDGQGILAMDMHTGDVKTRLEPDGTGLYPTFDCTSSCVFVESYNCETICFVELVAFDTADFRELWRHSFGRGSITTIVAGNTTVAVMVSDDVTPIPRPYHTQRFTLGVEDGRVVSRGKRELHTVEVPPERPPEEPLLSPAVIVAVALVILAPAAILWKRMVRSR